MRRCYYQGRCREQRASECASPVLWSYCAFADSEYGADAGTPVSGPSHCSPASPRAGDNGDGLEGKPPVPRRASEPGNKEVSIER